MWPFFFDQPKCTCKIPRDLPTSPGGFFTPLLRAWIPPIFFVDEAEMLSTYCPKFVRNFSTPKINIYPVIQCDLLILQLEVT